MTLMNTIANLGGTWPKFFLLCLIDTLTVKECHTPEGPDGKEVCETVRDGYFVMSIVCAFYGMLWYAFMRKRILGIQELDTSVWRVKNVPKND